MRTTTDHYLDFEDMVDSVFHENTHNWQDQLVKGLKLEGAEKNPLHEQALIFAVNRPFYLGWRDGSVSGYMAYRGQPMEAHAFRSGRLLGGDLMRMLAS